MGRGKGGATEAGVPVPANLSVGSGEKVHGCGATHHFRLSEICSICRTSINAWGAGATVHEAPRWSRCADLVLVAIARTVVVICAAPRRII